MITTKGLVPEIYYNDSRDFQFIGRLFEVAFNHVKTSVDTILNNPFSRNIDNKLLDLVAKTVGFETKHKYNVDDLKVICSCFKEIVKNKGSKKAIDILVRSLLKAQNIKSDYRIEIVNESLSEDEEQHSVIIIVPPELKDRVLVEDVLDYILPAGYNYRIISASVTDLSKEATEISVSMEVDESGEDWESYSADQYASLKANNKTGINIDIASLIPNTEIEAESGE